MWSGELIIELAPRLALQAGNVTTEHNNPMKTYKATGLVFGNYWGGGKGAFQSTPITASSRAEIIAQAEKMLDDGSLDGGMGYESLNGAILDVQETKTVEVNGEVFSKQSSQYEFIGKLTTDEEDFLEEALLNA